MANNDGFNIPPDLAGVRSAAPRAVSGGPEWIYWANLAVVDWYDACILSRGFDPRAIRGNALPREIEAELRYRESIAKSHLGRDLPSHVTDADRHHGRGLGTGVTLSEFREWGESLPHPFTFPDEFPRKQRPKRDVSDAKAKPAELKNMATRERNNLLRIIRALAEMSNLPDRGYAESIRTQLQTLGLTAPSDDTIRKAVDDARALDS